MSGEWGFDWDAEAARRADDAPEAPTMAASLPSRKGRHRRSNSTPLENTSSQLLTAASDSRAEEQEANADGSCGNCLQDVLNGSTLTKTRSERVKSRGGGRGIRRGALQSAARQNAALAHRVSGRMTKGRSKLSVLHEGYSTDEEEDSGEDGYQHVMGKGGKVRRVLANRQSAQRSRIRKLQHISELELTLEALQDDLFKLNPQLSKLEAKQAGLDDENKELQQKLATLKVESRQKEAVNQALAREVVECRHKQQTGQLGHKQQQQQQNHHLSHALPHAHAQASTYQHDPSSSHQQQHYSSPQSSYAQHMSMYPQMHPQALGQSQQQPTAAQADADHDHDFVERLMERYQYDQAQARHREQQAAHDSRLSHHHQPQQLQQQQQSYRQHDQQQQRQQQDQQHHHQQRQQQQHSGASAQIRSHQQSQRALDMLAELKQVASSSYVRTGYQDLDEAQAHAQWGKQQQEYQQQPAPQFAGQDSSPQVSQQGSHDSLEDRSSPQFIFSSGFPAGEMQYAQGQQHGGQMGFQLGQHSLDADRMHWATHNRSSLQQHSADGTHAAAQTQDRSDGFNRPTSQLQRRSFDGGLLEAQQQRQLADQHQQLLRSRSLTPASHQTALQRPGMRDSTQQQQQQVFSGQQHAGGESSGDRDAVRHLQGHSTGQTHLDASPFAPYQLHSQSHPGPQHQIQCSQASWPHTLSQSQSQSQPQNSPWEADERLFQAALPKKKSSGDMSRHGSGSTDGPLSEYVPAECILRSFDTASNASSEPSERSLGATQRVALGGFLRADGQNALLHGPAEAVRHAAWAKGMPPSGKKKKDNSQHRVALSRLT